MALIKCGDCGKEISSDAEKCIYCGKPHDMIIEGTKLRTSFMRGTIGAYKVFMIIMFSIMGLLFLLFRFYLGIIILGLILYFTFKKLNKVQSVLKNKV